MLPLAIANIAHLCKQFDLVCSTNFMPRFESIIFYQNSLKKVVFEKKMQNFQALGALPPDPPTQPPIANFWLST